MVKSKEEELSKIAGERKITLDKGKMKGIGEEIDGGGNGGSVKLVIFIIVIILLLAVAGALVYKNMKSGVLESDDNTEDVNIISPEASLEGEPGVVEEEGEIKNFVVNTELLDAEEAESFGEEEDYTNEDQNIETTGEDEEEYDLAKITAQPYTKFYRVEFEFDSATDGTVPETAVSFRGILKEVELMFMNTVDVASDLNPGESVEINDSVVTELLKSPKSDDATAVYKIKMSTESKYLINVVEDKVIVDVLELEEKSLEEEVVEEEENEEQNGEDQNEIEETEKENEENKEEKESEIGDVKQKVDIKGSGSKAAISGFTYEDTSEAFVYQLKLAGSDVPKVSSSAEKTAAGYKINLTIENLSSDGLTSDGKAYTDFAANGVVNVESMEVDFSGGVSRYTYTTSKPSEYSVYLDEDSYSENRIIIEIKR